MQHLADGGYSSDDYIEQRHSTSSDYHKESSLQYARQEDGIAKKIRSAQGSGASLPEQNQNHQKSGWTTLKHHWWSSTSQGMHGECLRTKVTRCRPRRKCRWMGSELARLIQTACVHFRCFAPTSVNTHTTDTVSSPMDGKWRNWRRRRHLCKGDYRTVQWSGRMSGGCEIPPYNFLSQWRRESIMISKNIS